MKELKNPERTHKDTATTGQLHTEKGPIKVCFCVSTLKPPAGGSRENCNYPQSGHASRSRQVSSTVFPSPHGFPSDTRLFGFRSGTTGDVETPWNSLDVRTSGRRERLFSREETRGTRTRRWVCRFVTLSFRRSSPQMYTAVCKQWLAVFIARTLCSERNKFVRAWGNTVPDERKHVTPCVKFRGCLLKFCGKSCFLGER